MVDPFAGTGTFLLAAGLQGRVAVGAETNPDQRARAATRGVTVEAALASGTYTPVTAGRRSS